MPPRYRRVDLASHRADQSTRRLAQELRTARLAAGLGLRDVATAAGLSASQLSRIERARSPTVPLRTLTTLFTVLGLRLSVRPYPEGEPIRDVAHARLLSRFKSRLSASISLRTEVPLQRGAPSPGGGRRDLRAWDGELLASGKTCKLEAETVLHDLQATDRRIALKMADDRVERVILLVASTSQNRQVLREFGELLRTRYPLTTRGVMAGLRDGDLPIASGIVVL